MPFDIGQEESYNITSTIEGVWSVYDDYDGYDPDDPEDVKTSFLIARFNNPRYRDYVRWLGRQNPYIRMLRRPQSKKAIEAQDIIADKAIARHILLGWKNFFEFGVCLEYTHDESERILTTPKYAGVKDWIVNKSMDLDLYRQQDREDAEGNLNASSPIVEDASPLSSLNG